MIRFPRPHPLEALISLLALSSALAAGGCHSLAPDARVSWALMLEDGAPTDSPAVRAWQSAADEEGYALTPLHDSEWLRPWAALRERHPVLIFADGFHPSSPPVVLETIRAQLAGGGSALIASDAFSKDFPGGSLRSLCERADGPRLPDFTYTAARFGNATSGVELTEHAPQLERLTSPGTWNDEEGHRWWSGYEAARKRTAHAVTAGEFPGQPLLRGEHGETLLGLAHCGPGTLLFANLPLTYLKGRTDGALMHAALQLLAEQGEPAARLLPVPDGVGGLVLNIHVDSNAAIIPLQKLDAQGFFAYGPFSVHVTAGPDARLPGDHLGFALDARPEAKALIARLVSEGHAIGSHGGWIHDYFGKNLQDHPTEPFVSYLEQNFDSLARAVGHPVLEYSAPIGNHPAWVTEWLEHHGVQAYYTTGNVGLGPTRTYLDGKRIETTSWAFPVNTLGTWASLEEFSQHGTPHLQVRDWLGRMSRFVADRREARLVYSHPPGLESYAPEVMDWLQETRKLEAQGRFQWYTMANLARFLSRREGAQWTEKETSEGTRVFAAASPDSLLGLTWCLPKTLYAEPQPEARHAQVTQDERCWLVRAGDFKALRFTARLNGRPAFAQR